MRPSGTPQQLELRRRKAIALLEQGHRNIEVARLVEASPGTICDWKKAYPKYGEAFFQAHSPLGHKPDLSDKQINRLNTLLLKGPRKHGYPTELWTLRRIAEVIEKHFAVAYDLSSVWHLLRRMGWSCQKPESKAREQNPEAVAQWRQTDWPRIKKARRTSKTVVFLDESGFLLQPTVRRTWAPKGQTSVLRSGDRRDRLSVLSAVTCSPKRYRLGLYFSIERHHIRAADFVAFVADLLNHFPRGILLGMDRWMVHRSGARQLKARFGSRADVEWLPAYAPELNPVEQVWNHRKYSRLTNLIPDHVEHLAQAVEGSLHVPSQQQHLLCSFFHCAKLKI